MTTISETMQDHHKHCDELYAAAEEAATNGDWAEAIRSFEAFRGALENHFSAEEEILFPAFEAATGMSGGPTQVMRMEHVQMRGLLAGMAAAAAGRDAGEFTGQADTLMILMQQHNLKEENILYPMCDRSLGARSAELTDSLRQRISATANA